MAAEDGSLLLCAQCENAAATLECFEEQLLYCASCSASLHSKRARLHHCVKPFRICDECEGEVARLKCQRCAGTEGEPLVFCARCSSLLHTKKARHHHRVEALDRVEAGEQKGTDEVSCEEVEALNSKEAEAASLSDKQGPAVSTTTSEKGFRCAEKPNTQELHETEKASAPVQVEKVAHTTPSCPCPSYPNFPPAPFSWHPFPAGRMNSTDFPLDGSHGNTGHLNNVPSSCHPHGLSNCSGFMSSLHQYFPVYYPHLGLFLPASTSSHGNSERAQPLASQSNLVFQSEDKADTDNLSHQQHCTVSETVHGSCSRKRSRPDATDTSPTLTTGTPQPELTPQCLLKRMHNAHTELQRNDLEKDCIENEHGIPAAEGCVENEHTSFPTEGRNELSPNILQTGDLSERAPMIDVTRTAIGEEKKSEHIVERSDHHCVKVSHGEGVSDKEPTSGSFGNALPNAGSCSKSSNRVISEVSLGERPRSEAFSELRSATDDVFGKAAEKFHLLVELPSASAPETLLNVQVDNASVEKVSIDDALAKVRPAEMRRPKEEFVDYFGEAYEGSPEMCLREKNPCRVSGKPSPKVSAAKNTLHENTGRPSLYPLRNSSARNLNVDNEFGKDSSEESHSEGDTSADDKTFNKKNYLRGSVTIQAVVTYSDDYDEPSSITGTIVRSLEHGLLSGTSNDDARRAVHDAQRRLTRYNLKQACTSEGGLQNTENLRTGSCVVDFVSTGPFQRSLLERWTYILALTVAKYFSSNYCEQKLKVIFYGIEQNAMCAGHAFAATFNRVTNLSADFVPRKLLDEGERVEIEGVWERANKSVFSRKSRMAYRQDLVDVLYRIPESSRWEQEGSTLKMGSSSRVPAFVGGSPNWVRNGISLVPVCSARSIWLEGVPKNKVLVKKYGYEAVKALALHSRKVCKAFLLNENWILVGFKLKYPELS